METTINIDNTINSEPELPEEIDELEIASNPEANAEDEAIPELPELPEIENRYSEEFITTPVEDSDSIPRLITHVRLGNEWEALPYDAGDLDLRAQEMVIVEVGEGIYYGIVADHACPTLPDPEAESIPKILRRATLDDLESIDKILEQEKQAGQVFHETVRKFGLDMKLAGVRYLLDGSHITFFYTADDRVDFREVVRELARIYHTRIEMWQIGVRDEARRLGGYGICGRQMCCASFLREFLPVTMKMAKEQGLTLAPTKISGSCGRLMCCLAYENEWYACARESMPRVGDMITWNGRTLKVQNQHMVTNELTVIDLKDGVIMRIPVVELTLPPTDTVEE